MAWKKERAEATEIISSHVTRAELSFQSWNADTVQQAILGYPFLCGSLQKTC